MPQDTSHNRRASDYGKTEHEQLTELLSEILQRLTPIEYFIENYEAMCPHRELLARAANNIVSMNAMKESLARVRLDVEIGRAHV